MKRLTIAVAVLPIFAMCAAAQEMTVTRKVVTNLPGSVMGNVVKGAAYSADEITESLQVLADGTRISNQSQVTVYRDGEGRVRREGPKEITIWDPVENVSYTLNPKSMTAVKSSMGRSFYGFGSAPQTTMGFAFTTTTTTTTNERAANLDAQAMKDRLDKLKAELAAQDAMVVNGNLANPQVAAAVKEQLEVAMQKVSKEGGSNSVKKETLGQQVMQGVTAEGTRTTQIIEAGAIGNDRPINVVSERWYSSDLQTPIMTKRTDPRTGEETFRLTNIRRGEPGADLFMLPPGYQLQEGPGGKLMIMSDKKEE